MNTVGDVIDRFGGPSKMAAAINVDANRIVQWRRRGSIPGEYWQAITDAGREQRLTGVTLGSLAAIHARKDAA